jgi:hypothetical protein
MAPAVVIRPILPLLTSVNQSAPSGPVTMADGPENAVGMVNSEMVPAVVILPIRYRFHSVNQSAPSGPAVIP